MSAEHDESAVPRRAGRPKRPALTGERIAREALALIDELGWPACTMTRLGQRLGVRAPSLYHHVDGQQGIVDLVRGLVVREIHDPGIVDLPWPEAYRRFGIAYYRAFSRHPNTIQVLSTTPVRDPETLRMYETFLEAMVTQGWDSQRAFEALLGLEHLALGFAYEWSAEELMLDSDVVAAHGAPILAEATRGRTDQTALAERTFLGLLGRHIDMYRREVESQPGSGSSTPPQAPPPPTERTPE